jgi:hypothetical protein
LLGTRALGRLTPEQMKAVELAVLLSLGIAAPGGTGTRR